MKTLKTSILMILLAVFVGPVRAEDESADQSKRDDFRQNLLEEFDEDGSGDLNSTERNKAREKMKGRRGKDGPKGRRGGKGGEGPPNPDELFKRFDANGDGQLSRDEFHKLAESMREHHERHARGKGPRGEGPGRHHGPAGDNGDQPGPRGEGRRDFRPADPLQNPGDRPGKPPRAGKGRRGGGPDGPRGEGHEGRRPPNPDEIFDRFDVDDNGQLSREEFGKLSNAMRKLHGHDKGKKMGKGRGERRGPDGKGRSGRQKLLDRDKDAGEKDAAEDAEKESPASEDDSV